MSLDRVLYYCWIRTVHFLFFLSRTVLGTGEMSRANSK